MKTFVAIIKIIRPHQWLKNLMLFFPPFLSGAFLPAAIISHGLIPFAAFCSASSANYILNDLVDCGKDSMHTVKRNRPLPSGQIHAPVAIALCCVLLLMAVTFGLQVSKTFLFYIVVYLGLSVAYTLLLKQMPIVDVFCISFGFVLRLYGGGEAFGVHISDWLFLSVFLLATFLSFGKRYSELRQLGAGAGVHRRTLEEYPEGFLDGALYLSGSAVLVTYAMYAITKPAMVYTVPLCAFGLLRYLMRVKTGRGGDPTDALLCDIPLLLTGIFWVALVGWCVYL